MHMIVHDLKNPLTAILGTLSLFRKDTFGLPREVAQLLSDANAQGFKLLNMIEDILLVSRMRSKEFEINPQELDLDPFVLQCVEMMTKTLSGKPLALQFVPSQHALKVHADPEVLERVINNLLNNAIKYAPKQTEVRVETLSGDSGTVVRVTNWGPAIPLEYHEKIFDLFCRVKADSAKYSGTGLGLTFCKLAVEAHGGLIWVESPLPDSDRGARFNFSIPATPPANPS
jgi:signal transduction histidine kinase